MYEPVYNHFLFKYRGKLYDSTGIVKTEEKPIP